MRCSYDRGLDRLASLPQLRQVDIKRFPHFGPDETEQLLQVLLHSVWPSYAGKSMQTGSDTMCLCVSQQALVVERHTMQLPLAWLRVPRDLCNANSLQSHPVSMFLWLTYCLSLLPRGESHNVAVLTLQQAEGIEQVNDRCKLVRRHSVAPQRALDIKLQGVALT